MEQENQVRELIGYAFKGNKIVFSKILRMTKSANNTLQERKENKRKFSKTEFLKKNNNAESVRITEMDKRIWAKMAKKYNIQYAVEYNKEKDESYIYFNCSASKLETALKEYEYKLDEKRSKNKLKSKEKEIKKTIKSHDKDGKGRKVLDNKELEKAKEKMLEK